MITPVRALDSSRSHQALLSSPFLNLALNDKSDPFTSQELSVLSIFLGLN